MYYDTKVAVDDKIVCNYPDGGNGVMVPRVGRIEKVASWGILVELKSGDWRSFNWDKIGDLEIIGDELK